MERWSRNYASHPIVGVATHLSPYRVGGRTGCLDLGMVVQWKVGFLFFIFNLFLIYVHSIMVLLLIHAHGFVGLA
jgi:hypothetical protein